MIRALLTISRPCFAEQRPARSGILNAERNLDDLRGLVTLFAVDRLFKEIRHRTPHVCRLDYSPSAAPLAGH